MLEAHHRPARFIAAAIFALFGAVGARPALAADPVTDARSVIQSMWDAVIPVLANKGMDKASREAQFAMIYRANFDNAGIAAAVAGAAWQQATPTHRAQFQRLFETYVIKVYAGQFATYNGERMIVVRSEPDGDGAVVTSQIGDAEGARRVELKWRLRPTENGLKVRDVIVENISMTLNQRREFAAVLHARGGTLEGLTGALRDKIVEIDRKP